MKLGQIGAMTPFDRVAVLHVGGNEDLNVIRYISQCFQIIGGPRLDYQQTIPDSQKDVIVTRNIKKYADTKLPMIVILSQDFFDAIWPTASKPSILNSITNYAHNLSLHIWCANMDTNTIKRYSTMLIKHRPNFRTVCYDKLQFMTHEEVGQELINLLQTPQVNPELKRNYSNKGDNEEPTYIAFAGRKSTTERRQVERRRYMKDDANQMAAIAAAVEMGEDPANVTGASKSKKKKKKKKKPDDELLVGDMTMRHYYELAPYLDGHDVLGNDYKGLAAKLNFSTTEINKFASAFHKGDKPTVHLLTSVSNRYPEMRVKQLENILKQMQRNDVVKYLKENVFSGE